ncbi:hypothetical protein NLG97_g10067 [Lecanicillium saksenae]|uniref:Uncharacterized protein n=1 Tax=Lecanicillium saksenae TaxID=468837 RepID=A0ACC1QE95_9HYPO|nr:hypothetical protein NLG97_g10067 [Lecanicillium saksenae]
MSMSWSSSSRGADGKPAPIDSFSIGRDLSTAVKFSIVPYYDACSRAARIKHWKARVQEQSAALPIAPSRTPRVEASVASVVEVTPATTLVSKSTDIDLPYIGDIEKVKYKTMGCLGRGHYGTVIKAGVINTKRELAVKILFHKTKTNDLLPREQVMREVAIQFTLDHVSASTQDGIVHTNEGVRNTLLDALDLAVGILAMSKFSKSFNGLFRVVLHQMLQALDYLDTKGIVHRDLKPDNILYAISRRELREEELRKGTKTTTKVDVWSLFVTMLWIANLCDIRGMSDHCGDYGTWLNIVLDVTRMEWVNLEAIQPMAVVDTDKRASTAQMLVAQFDDA